MKPQAAFFDGDVGPNPRHQVLLADDFIRRGNQRDQDVERSRTQIDRDAVFGEKPFARDQIEGTKRQPVAWSDIVAMASTSGSRVSGGTLFQESPPHHQERLGIGPRRSHTLQRLPGRWAALAASNNVSRRITGIRVSADVSRLHRKPPFTTENENDQSLEYHGRAHARPGRHRTLPAFGASASSRPTQCARPGDHAGHRPRRHRFAGPRSRAARLQRQGRRPCRADIGEPPPEPSIAPAWQSAARSSEAGREHIAKGCTSRTP